MGMTSGMEREEMRSGGASLPALPPDVAPKILMNSVSGEVMVAPFHFCCELAALPKILK
jgi:hypothetical protein